MKLIVICLLFFNIVPMPTQIEISELRDLYYQAAVNKDASSKLSKLLANVDEKDAAVLIAYKAAAQLIEAKYAFSPFTKISRFNKGKASMEKAVRKDPNQVEVRFLRFSIQTNLPSFLGYNDAINGDKKMLLNAVPTLVDSTLKKNVINYLLISNQCTPEELKKLRNWQKA